MQTTIQDDLWVWVKTMPAFLAFCVGVFWLLARIFKDELKAGVVKAGKWLVLRVVESARTQKPLRTKQEHDAQAVRYMQLHQYTQRICDTIGCDHVTVYASLNGEYLKNRESVEKLLVISEAVPQASQSEPRYMQKSRLIYTSDISAIWLACCRNPYALVQQGEAQDEFANRLMRQRGYQSSLLTLITTKLPGDGGQLVLGLLACSWKGVRVEETADGLHAHITPRMLQMLARFRTDLSDLMDGKPTTDAP